MDSSSSPSETVEIDPAGDVLFIVGPSPLKVRLLVSSKALSLASPVFAAMFSPHFKEGSALSSDSPSEIPLPEDDSEALTVLCNCLHFRTDRIPRNVEFSLLRSLAVLCDKYNCAKAIAPWSILWLQKWQSEKCEDGFEGLLIVVYALDCAEAFKKASKRAILEQVGPFDTRRMIEGLETVPENLLVDIDANRGAIQAGLHTAIEKAGSTLLSAKCGYPMFWPHSYLQGLKTASLWPLSEAFRQQSLATIMQRIYWIPEPDYSNRGRCGCSICSKTYVQVIRDDRAQHLSMVTGLCLDCVKGGGSKAKDKECRVSHS